MPQRKLETREKFQAAAIGAFSGITIPLKAVFAGAITFGIGHFSGADANISGVSSAIIASVVIVGSVMEHYKHVSTIGPHSAYDIAGALIFGSATINNNDIDWKKFNQKPAMEKIRVTEELKMPRVR